MKGLSVARLCRFFCLVLCLCLTLGSCGGKDAKSAEEVVLTLLEQVGQVPDGVLYRSGAAKGDEGYLSEEDLALLYGEGIGKYELPLVKDYALYLSSFATPFEVAVFRCYERSDADRLGAILLSRADALKVSLRECGWYDTYGEGICVTVTGRYAILVLSAVSLTEGELCEAVR